MSLRLTTLEEEVLQLLGRRYTNRQIAAELTIGVKTVRKRRFMTTDTENPMWTMEKKLLPVAVSSR